ncbi:MAG: sensor histidine kinase [Sphaerochaeta sp.]
MFNNKLLSNRFYLFLVFGMFSTILVLVFCLYSFSYNKNNLLKSIDNELDIVNTSTCSSIVQNVDQLSTISMNVIYSNGIKSNFKEFTQYFPNIDSPNDENYVSTREKVLAISDYIFAMIGPVQSTSRVNLYSFDGAMIKLGFSTTFTDVDLESFDWYRPTVELNGKKFITTPHVVSDIPNYSISDITSKYISLIRVFFNKYNQKEGILEIVQNCNKIFEYPIELMTTREDIKAFVFNERDELLFPFSDNIYEEFSYDDDLRDLSYEEILNNDNYIVHSSVLESYGWKVIVCMPKTIVASKMDEIRKNFIILLIITLCITLIVCFIISGSLTSPINKLKKITNETNLKNIIETDENKLEVPKIKIREIAELWEAYELMIVELKETSKEVLLLQSEEIKSKLLMSQSFVRPHFIYNCLSNISVMADENLNTEISQMCSSLANYLRYLSATSETILETIEKEAQNTQHFLSIMQLRYPEEFKYEIEYDEKIKDFKIPKLILQSLTENTFKHAFIDPPPWKLNIKFTVEDNKWKAFITDNGGNFSDFKKEQIMNEFDNLNIDDELNNFHIGNFGLKNTFIRLKMRYKEDAVFQIINSKQNETTIIIGGTIIND